MLPLAMLCWWAGHGLMLRHAGPEKIPTPAFAIAGSAYGSLAARLIRDSLYSYWHGGEGGQAMPVLQSNSGERSPAPPPPPPGRFARRGQPLPPPPVATPTQDAARPDLEGLDALVDRLARLEKARTRRNSTFPLSPAHQRYVDASAATRLKLAYSLDPGDAVLYEVLHFHLTSRPDSRTTQALQTLTDQAMNHGLRPQGSLSDALTAAGAAINVLNDQLQPGRPGGLDLEKVQSARTTLREALARYATLRHQAAAQGWWQGIPPIRRSELENHAAQLRRIADLVEADRSGLKPGGSR